MKRTIIPGTRAWKLLQGLAAGCVGAVAAAVLFLPGWLDRWEARTWDWRVSIMARPSPATEEIRLILLDQSSLDWGRDENRLSWPWPREVYAPVVQFCKRAGARALAFDVLFTEPSRYGVWDDRALAAAMETFPVVTALFLSTKTGRDKNWPDFAPPRQFIVSGMDLMDGREAPMSFPRAATPVEELASAAAILANVHLSPDPDTVYRRVSLFSLFDGRVVPSLALGTFLAAREDVSLALRPGFFSVGDKDIPVNAAGEALLRFRGPSGTHRAYSAAAIIQNELRLQAGEDPVPGLLEDFRDAYVFFGFTAPGLLDLRPTPVSGVYPGVEIFATMLDNLLAADFMRSVPTLPVVILTLLLALLSGAATAAASGIAVSIAIYGACIAMPVVLCFGAYSLGYWLPLVVQQAAVIVTIAVAGLMYYTTEGRQKQFIKNAFRQYLSPTVIDELIARPERLKLGGERRILTIFFSDLEGFTSIAEGMDPETLTNLLNTYLSAMTDCIHLEAGTVDKYEGDAIIAFWNAPLDQPDHAVRCVRAALRCRERLAEMAPAFQSVPGGNLRMRIGINTGPAVVGNMGSHARFDYTMIGDAVNLAARLEGLNKQFGTTIIIAEATMNEVTDTVPAREIARVAVVGRQEPVVVFEPLASDEDENDTGRHERMALFDQGLRRFYAGDYSAAEELFSRIAGADPVACAYVRRCGELARNSEETFRGLWVAGTK